jgi:hypothetical protein
MADEVNGFGDSSVEELNALRKALSVGYANPPTSGGDALRVESLEATLKVLSFQATHIKFWNEISKTDAYSTVEEYALLSNYGGEGGGFVDGSDTPEESDTTYSRETQRVKYVGTTRGVEYPATLVRSVPGDVVAQETSNGVMWMLGKIERGLFLGDSACIAQEWNGVIAQCLTGGASVVDLRGAALATANVEDAADIIASNYGAPTSFYANNKVFADFGKAYYGQQRWQSPNTPAGMVGVPLTGMSTQAGDVKFVSDVFLKAGAAPPTAATSTKAPNAPTIVPGTPGGSGSQFLAADAGTYKYAVTAVNKYGESLPSAWSANVTYTTGQNCDIVITDTGGTYGATCYRIYRTDKAGVAASTGKFVTQVAKGGATTTWNDTNAFIQGTYQGLMADLSPQSMVFKQLSPLIKIPLAITGPTIRWMQLLYGTPIVFAPKRNVIFRNIGVA